MNAKESNHTPTHPKILILDEEFPFPLNSGKRIRSFNLLKLLSRSFSVDYLAYGKKSSESYNAIHSLGVRPTAVLPHSFSKKGLKFYLKALKSLFSFEPYIVTDHFSREYEATLRSLSVENHYDLVITEWTPYARFVQGVHSVPHIVVAHNIEWRIWAGYHQQERNVGKRWYISNQIRKLKEFEQTAWQTASAVVAVSPVEEQIIKQHAPGTPIAMVENGVDTKYFSTFLNCPEQQIFNPSIVFIGALDWRPNQDAARFLLEEILPVLQSHLPNIQTVIVGRNPDDEIARLCSKKNAILKGTVPDVRPFMHKNAVFVVPLRIGGGSRLKILEAASMSMGIVTTSRGSDGLSLRAGEHFLQSDEPRSFAENVIRLLKDGKLRNDLGNKARDYVEIHYDWSSVYSDYEKMIWHILGRCTSDS